MFLPILSSLRAPLCIFTVLFAPVVPSSWAAVTDDPVSEYAALSEWKYCVTSAKVPADGIQLAREHTAWTMSSGYVRAMRPTGDDRVTGYFFEGRGVFELSIPNPIEISQLARFSDQPKTATLKEPFSRLIIRTVQDLSSVFPGVPAQEPFDEIGVVKKRHQAWHRSAMFDIDARVLAGLLTRGDDFLVVEMETERFGWLTLRLDGWSSEPLTLAKLHEPKDYVEHWVRLPHLDGLPGLPGHKRIDLIQVSALIDLTDHDGREFRAGRSTEGDIVRFKVTEQFTPLVDGSRALQFNLRGLAKVNRVTTVDGADLPFIRAPFGQMYSAIDNDISDGSIVVVFPEALRIGEIYRFVTEYEIKIYNYVSGLRWYPTLPEMIGDLHTSRLVFRHAKGFDVRAVGSQTAKTTEAGVSTTTWEMTRPTMMIGFSFGKKYREETLQIEGGPEIVVFGKSAGATTGNMLRNVAIDLAKSLHFFHWYFDTPLPNERIFAGRISSGHGQAFDGFIHLSHYTFDYENSGAAELFRSHEAAHQYWGHLVGWKTYRDQWLSEGLAEYSSMLFLEATMGKEKYFEEILKVYFSEQLGSRGADMSRFARPWYQLEYDDIREEIGPIGVGYRASTARVPYGYSVQSYNKGALVFHMLRVMIRDALGNDDRFRTILKDFIHTYSGVQASTDDLAAILAKHLGGDWNWFFDQWVYGTDIPTYEWDYSLPRTANPDGTYAMTVTVRQSGVPNGFKMPVPIEVEFGGNNRGRISVILSKPEETFTINLQKKPKKVIFNPDYSVLAHVKRF